MLRRFDYVAAQNVTDFIANSKFVAERIRKYYDRESTVIYPPVAVDEFCSTRPREPFTLVVSELVPYKRIDIAVEAFNRLGTKLVVIGDGPERKRLQTTARPNIEFMGRQPFAVLKDHYERANAFIFPGIEDFGITPVEAQASGCPVIALRAGGALETVIDGSTGFFFDDENSEALAEAVQRLATNPLKASTCARHAKSFSIERFRQSYQNHLIGILGDRVHPIEAPVIEALAG
jgi:glycosyltransferase involved in cell wall biosynthesis